MNNTAEALTLVPARKIEKDPRNLAYLYPSMPVGRYKQATEEYYHFLTIQAIEQAARINKQIMIPACCLHWERKKRFSHQNIRVFGKSYYLLGYEEITKNEFLKYEEKINEI